MFLEKIKQFKIILFLEKIKQFKIILIIAVIFAVVAVFFLVGLIQTSKRESPVQNILILQPQTNEQGGVWIEVSPIGFDSSNPQFQVNFTTHQGNLDFDLKERVVLIVDNQTEYQPLLWSGGRGDHHLSGVLSFPAINSEAKNIKLIIKDVYGIAAREFFWAIPQ